MDRWNKIWYIHRILDRLINTCIARQIKCIMYTKLKCALNLHLIYTNWASNMVLFKLYFGADVAH